MTAAQSRVRLDLNSPVFQEQLFDLEKEEQQAVLGTLKKIRQLSWNEVYRSKGLRWEKILSVRPPKGADAIYSLRITRSRRCTACRDGDFMRFLTIEADHDSTYGKK